MEKFFHTGSKAGIQAKHASKLRLQLFALDNAKHPGDMNAGMEASSAGRRIQRSLGRQRER
jgi:plasmid maintenance system killer protein